MDSAGLLSRTGTAGVTSQGVRAILGAVEVGPQRLTQLRPAGIAPGYQPGLDDRMESAVAAEFKLITPSAVRTPRAAAIAGILFALLLGTALVLLRLAVPANPADSGRWLIDSSHRNSVGFALNLVPFAGISFLWFMGAVRDRLGDKEDKFFATLFSVAAFCSSACSSCSPLSQGGFSNWPQSTKAARHCRCGSLGGLPPTTC